LYDLVIIGAGPAGATLARAVGRQYRVLLVDKRADPAETGSPYGKCCGGLLAPDAQKALARMGAALPREALVGPQILTVRAMDLPAGRERFYQRFYINVDRGKFDRWLISLVPPSVEMRFGCRFAGMEREGASYRLHLYREQRRETVRTRVVVGADGASSRVRRWAFPRSPGPRCYLALQERYYAAKALPYFSAIFDPEITDFYAWTIPKEGSLLLGAALFPGKTAAAKFALLKKKLVSRGYCLDQLIRRESALILRPSRCAHLLTGREGMLLIGEAAGWISPSSAEGLSYAFTSAAAAAKALAEGLTAAPERYRRLTAPLKRTVLLKNIKAPFIYTPPLRRLIMASGLSNMKMDNG
jgi:geranylgeranyl reductase